MQEMAQGQAMGRWGPHPAGSPELEGTAPEEVARGNTQQDYIAVAAPPESATTGDTLF